MIDSRFSLKIGYLGFERFMNGFATWKEQFPTDQGDINVARMQRRDLKSFGEILAFGLDFSIECELKQLKHAERN